MEYRPSRPPYQAPRQPQPENQKANMSMLTMTIPSMHVGFRHEHAWDTVRSPDYARPISSAKPIALPSIRQAFPEFQLSTSPQDGTPRPPSSITSPGSSVPAVSEYVFTSASRKRRRSSVEDNDPAARPRQAPRLFNSPDSSILTHVSTSPIRPRAQPVESWPTTARSRPYSPSLSRPSPPQAIAVTSRSVHHSVTERPLPSTMELERGQPFAQSAREFAPSDFANVKPPAHRSAAGVVGERPSYHDVGHAHSYHHPSRHQSLSTSSIRSYDRTPFTAASYGPSFHDDLARYGDVGGISGDAKQRKRRGNLPKETTDKLRSWFVAHLQHPYPTEDEKQDLMRQTGLQMNQISNWFINARRRQLPTMINNARAEAGAMSARSNDGKILESSEKDYFRHDHREKHPLSDAEGPGYDEDLSVLAQRGAAHLKRGSV